VAGVGLGADSVAVRRAFGAPDSIVVLRDAPGGTAWNYPSIRVLFSPYDASVAGFDITGPRFGTVRGLHIGDSRGRALQLYGDAQVTDSTEVEFDYSDSDSQKAIIVSLRNGIVSRLYVGRIFD